MQALQFRMSVPRIVATRALGLFSSRAFTSALAPVQLEEIPDARVRGDRWVVVRPALTGICGSDQKQLLLKGHFDNPISGVLSFPHVLGHESAGVVAEVGSARHARAAGRSRRRSTRGSRASRAASRRSARRAPTATSRSARTSTAASCRPGLHLGNCTTRRARTRRASRCTRARCSRCRRA